MPLFNFKYEFHPYIIDGTKHGTIRKFRANTPRVGQLCHLYPPRFSKPYKPLIPPAVCTQLKTIFMLPNGSVFSVNGITHPNNVTFLLADDASCLKFYYEYDALSCKEKDALAWADGFRNTADPADKAGCFNIMYGWFKHTHQLDTTPFAGLHIFWQPPTLNQ